MYSTLFRIAAFFMCFACSTVVQAATWTTTALTVTPTSTPTSPTAAGANVKLAAFISSGIGIPKSGSISFYHGTTLIGTVDMKGTSPVILNTKMLPVGNLQLKAVFNANTQYDTSESNIVAYLVVGGATTTVLNSSMNPANYGTSVTLTATVAGAAPPDTVMFYDGLKLMGTSTVTTGGIATFSTSNLAIGSHNLSAAYSGSGSLAPSTSAPFTQTIKTTGGGSGTTTTTVVTSSSSSVPTGTAVTLTATVTGGTPTGTVTFYDGSAALGTKNITNGIATLETSTLTEGPHTITVTYHGSATHQVSTSSTFSQTITPIGGGSGSGSANSGGGSCGIGSGLASIVMSLLLLLSLRLLRA